MSVEWFYRRAGQVTGPLTAAQLREHALAKKVAPADHVRRRGDSNWVSASKVRGLFDPPPAQPPLVPVVLCPVCRNDMGRSALDIATTWFGYTRSGRDRCRHAGCAGEIGYRSEWAAADKIPVMAYIISQRQELSRAGHPYYLYPEQAIEALGETAQAEAVGPLLSFLEQITDEFASSSPATCSGSTLQTTAKAFQRLNDPRAVAAIIRFLRAAPAKLPLAAGRSSFWGQGTAEAFLAAVESLVTHSPVPPGPTELAELHGLPDGFEFERLHYDIYDSNSDSYIPSGATYWQSVDCSAAKRLATVPAEPGAPPDPGRM